MWEVIGWIYLAGVLGFFLPTAKFAITMTGDKPPCDSEEIVLGIVMAFCAVWFWPLFIPGAWAYRLLKDSD